jgi:hypothetical protein
MDIMNSQYDDRLWKILEKEKLADLSQFHRANFIDEVPLFSREADIAFLKRNEGDGTAAVLIHFAIKFLKAVIAYEEHRTGYFAAITVGSNRPNPPVPHLFVSCQNVRTLKSSLALDTPSDPFSKRIRKIVSGIRVGDRFEVCQDVSGVSGISRAFIGPTEAPYRGFLTLSGLRTRTKAAG